MQAEFNKKLHSGSLEYISSMTGVHSEVVLEGGESHSLLSLDYHRHHFDRDDEMMWKTTNKQRERDDGPRLANLYSACPPQGFNRKLYVLHVLETLLKEGQMTSGAVLSQSCTCSRKR
jgi:hypothetical protein